MSVLSVLLLVCAFTGPSNWAVIALGSLAAVAVPAVVVRNVKLRRVVVHPDRLCVYRGEKLLRALPFADLTMVGAQWDYFQFAGNNTRQNWFPAITLIGTSTAGKRRGFKASGMTLQTIDPLVRALVPVVAARPELMRGSTDRELFAQFGGNQVGGLHP